MRRSEAYLILELSSDATPEEIKKQYRKLTKKYHPDVNKDTNADDKFKKINEAYSVIQSGKDNEPQFNQNNSGIDLEDFINQHMRKHRVIREIHSSITLTFKEGVFGCKKDIQYKRNVKCESCGGQGQIIESNGCGTCGGTGRIFSRQGPISFFQPCNVCKGKQNIKQCTECVGKCVLEADTSITVTIPGGVKNGNILRIAGKGEYVGSGQNPFTNQLIDQYTDAFLHLIVAEDLRFKIDGNAIVTNCDISLLDALTGCSIEIITLDGQHMIEVPPSSKNKDIVSIPNLGVGREGPHNVVMNIDYPKDTNKLIDFLKNKD